MSEGSSCFRPRARKPKAPRPSRPCRSTGSAQIGAQFSPCLRLMEPGPRPGGQIMMPRRHGSARPHAATRGRPLPGPAMQTIVDLRLSAALPAQAAPEGSVQAPTAPCHCKLPVRVLLLVYGFDCDEWKAVVLPLGQAVVTNGLSRWGNGGHVMVVGVVLRWREMRGRLGRPS